MPSKRLTSIAVLRQKRPGRYADGGGLYLQVQPSSGKDGVSRLPAVTKSWLFRFMRNGRAREMGLGPVDLVPLTDARDVAHDCRKMLLKGVDPIDARQEQRQKNKFAIARLKTFRECAETYIAAHEGTWRNHVHRRQWKATLATYVYPQIGDLEASAVDTGLVMKIVEPLWAAKPETAGRIRGRIETILDWAKVSGFREGENPARWKGHLDHLLPRRSRVARVKHHPALPYQDLPLFMAELRARKGQSACALEFTILTASRTGATIGARRDEIDLKAKTWTVPPERTGAKIVGEEPTPRRVPLSDRAIEIIRSLPREDDNPYLFIGAKAAEPLSNMAMAELMRDMRPGFVPHGFRSTFKDWCSETTNYPNEVSEAALWHVVADKVEAAYRRGELFEKRRLLMKDWATYLRDGPLVPQ
jgi:integrase